MRVSWRYRGVWLAAGLALVAAAAGLGQGQTKPSKDPATAKEAAPDVKADLADAIKSLESSQYDTFLEKYAPVEMLRQARDQNAFMQFARRMAADPETRGRMIATLKLMAKHEPEYDRSRGVASFTFDPSEDDAAPVAKPVERPAPKVWAGYGSDLPEALAAAEKALGDRDYRTFVLKMFPPGALDSQGVEALVAELKDDPAMAKRMADDLKSLKTLKPEMTDGGKTASFKLGGAKPDGTTKPTKGAKGAKKGEAEAEPAAERVVKFSLIGDDWRFFDDTARVSKALGEFASGKGRKTTVTIKMERIGGNWRIQQFDL